MSLKRRLVTVLFWTTAGSLMELTSIGCESMMAVILLLLYPLTPAVVSGTRMGTAGVLSLVTSFARRLDGNFDLTLVGTLLLGSMPALLIGANGPGSWRCRSRLHSSSWAYNCVLAR